MVWEDFNIKFKIIFVFITLIVTLLGIYVIAQTSFRDLLLRVEKLSTPDQKLLLVNEITRNIISLHQNERIQLVQDQPTQIQGLKDEYSRLYESLDELKTHFNESPQQMNRLDSIQLLLRNRDFEVQKYLEARFNLGLNPQDWTELEALNKKALVQDTLSVEEEIVDDSESKGFFNKVFGIFKKKEKEVEKELPQDTLPKITEKDVENTIKKISEVQDQSVSELLNRDRALQESGNSIINQALTLLSLVENEALRTSLQESQEAQDSVKLSISKTLLIFIILIIIISILLYLILKDIRKNNQYRKEIEKAKDLAEAHAESRKKFLSHMSHELRTPLQAVIGFSELLMQKNHYDKKSVQGIHDSAEHLLYVVNDVLDQSKIESGKITLNTKVIDLETTARTLIQSLKPLAESKNLNLSFQFNSPYEKEIISIDEFRLKQILYNLISNAIKFTQEGNINLEINTQKPDFMFIEVSDTGVGIEEAYLDKIFEEYEQIERDSFPSKTGTGLGLHIIKSIIEAMGGEIRVESKVQKGSKFTVKLPLVRSESGEIDLSEGFNLSIKDLDEKLLVWILDDDAWIRKLCENIFKEYPINHVIFKSAEELFQYQYDQIPTHILTDIRMPHITGYDVLEELKNRKELQNTKIIAFTAEALPFENVKLKSSGFDEILIKPFKARELFKVLNIQFQSSDMVITDDIGELFKKETLEDVKNLKESFHANDFEKIEGILHKLGGRIAQMGFDTVAFKIRKMEIEVRAGDELPAEKLFSLCEEIENLTLNFSK